MLPLICAGMQNELGDPFEAVRIDPLFGEVMDLVKGLPDAMQFHSCREDKIKCTRKDKNKKTSISPPNRKSPKNPSESSIKIISNSPIVPGETLVLQSNVLDLSSPKNVASV